jgi:hypothetical protein
MVEAMMTRQHKIAGGDPPQAPIPLLACVCRLTF